MYVGPTGVTEWSSHILPRPSIAVSPAKSLSKRLFAFATSLVSSPYNRIVTNFCEGSLGKYALTWACPALYNWNLSSSRSAWVHCTYLSEGEGSSQSEAAHASAVQSDGNTRVDWLIRYGSCLVIPFPVKTLHQTTP